MQFSFMIFLCVYFSHCPGAKESTKLCAPFTAIHPGPRLVPQCPARSTTAQVLIPPQHAFVLAFT